MRKLYALILCFFLFHSNAFTQYQVNGQASELTPGEFRLNPKTINTKGSVFNTNTLDLSLNFEIVAQLYFGASNDSADGVAFLLQREGPGYIGNSGAGLGYHRNAGSTPGPVSSFIVEFDTHQDDVAFNGNVADPSADHLSFMSHSNAFHSSTTALNMPFNLPNIEDDAWHTITFRWNAATQVFTVDFLGQVFSYSNSLSQIVGGVTGVYWGFTSGAGSLPNEHKVRIISYSSSPVIIVTPMNVTCNTLGASCSMGGGLNLEVTGGTPPYSYQWSNGAATQDLINIPAGNYTVTVTDDSYPQQSSTYSYSVLSDCPTMPVSVSGTKTDANCTSGGSISLGVFGGTSPFTYSWSNGSTTKHQSNLSPGTYSVTVKDASSPQKTATASFTIGTTCVITPLVAVGNLIAANCGSGGGVDLIVSGGTPPYQFSWSNGATTEDLVNLVPGTYSVSISDASNPQQTITHSFTVENNCIPLAIVGTSTTATCGYGGGVNVTVSGGTLPYNYSWSNGVHTEDLSNTAPGTYTVTVTDASVPQQVKTMVFTISNSCAPMALSGTTTTATCTSGGTIDLTVTGGSAPYTYSWSNGSITQDLANLPAGNYSVTVSDGSLPQQSATATYTVGINCAAMILSANTGSANCGLGGSVNLSVSGGTAPYTYSWSNGTTTQDLSNVPPGNYSVIVTDASIPQQVKTATYSVGNNCTTLIVTNTVTPATCISGGTIDLQVSGGLAPYSYAWSNGSNTQDLQNVPAGTYSVLIKDASNPQQTFTGNYTVGSNCISTTTPLAVTGIITSATCGTGGSVNIQASGGTPPYSYSWSNGSTSEDLSNMAPGTYSVVIKDAGLPQQSVSSSFIIGNNCTVSPITVTCDWLNASCVSGGKLDITVTGGTPPYQYTWSNGQTTQDLINYPTGTYSVTIKDASTPQQTLLVYYSIGTSCQPLSLSGSANAAGCTTGGSINVTVSGGTGPYHYSWSNGSTTEDLVNLSPGNYTATVTDGSIPQQTATATFTVINSCTVAPLAINGNTTNASCGSTGSVNITVSGGTPPYHYTWSNGSSSEDLINLPSGIYTVTVTDNSSPQLTKTAQFSVNTGNDVTPPVISCNNTTNLCRNNSGQYNIPLLVANDNCGIANIIYQVTGATTRSGSGKNASGSFNQGISTITWLVRDNSGNISTCTSQVNVIKLNTSVPNAYVVNPGSAPNTIYKGFANSSITLNATVTGGNGNYTYQWSTGATGPSITVAPAQNGNHTYSVIATDANGCSATASKAIRVVDIRCGNDKIKICHKPPGNSDNFNELCLNTGSVMAHLGHGDMLGECPDDDDDDDGGRSSNEIPGSASPNEVYPNPTGGMVNIKLPPGLTGEVTVILMDVSGIVLESRKIQTHFKNHLLRIDLSNKAPGIYFIKLLSGPYMKTEKIILKSEGTIPW